MIHFDMAVSQNFASFTDEDTKQMIFVESFDNVEFEVRAGSALTSIHVATFTANSDFELNAKLCELFNK